MKLTKEEKIKELIKQDITCNIHKAHPECIHLGNNSICCQCTYANTGESLICKSSKYKID